MRSVLDEAARPNSLGAPSAQDGVRCCLGQCRPARDHQAMTYLVIISGLPSPADAERVRERAMTEARHMGIWPSESHVEKAQEATQPPPRTRKPSSTGKRAPI